MNAHAMREGPPRPAASEDRWKALTQQANAAYANRENGAADDLYRSALAEAELLLCSAENGAGTVQAPALLVISHHNLAQFALRRGRPSGQRHTTAMHFTVFWRWRETHPHRSGCGKRACRI